MHHTIPCPWEKKGIVMRKAMEYTEKMDRTLIDGITVNNPDSTIVLFPDKERPAFIVAVEASSDSSAMHIAEEYKQLITNWAETQS
jgi:mannose-1-phosphate guanylyltransferase/phosphomannomutase